MRQFWRRRRRRILIHAGILGSGIAVCVLATAVLNGILFPALPYPTAGRLVWIGGDSKYDNALGMSMSQYDALSEQFAQDVIFSPYMLGSMSLRTDGGIDRIPVVRVGGNFFSVLGTRANRGRLLTGEDDRDGTERVVVISADLWRRVFASDSTLVGRRITLDENVYRVVGIIDAGKGYPSRAADVWIPLAQTIGPTLRSTDAPYVAVLGRLKPSPSLTPELAILRIRSALKYLRPHRGAGSDAAQRVVAEPLLEHLVTDVRLPIILLSAAALFLMFVACVSAATIQLAAQGTFERDVAIRRMLGATLPHLWRDTMGEAVAIWLLSGLGGFGAAALVLHLLRTVGESTLTEMQAVHLNGTTAMVTATLAALAAIAVTAVPMITLLRRNTSGTLSTASQNLSASRSGRRFRDVVTGTAIAVTVVFALGAASAGEAIYRIVSVDMGFDGRGTVVATVRLPYQQVTSAEAAQLLAFVRGFKAAMNDRPDARQVAVSTDIPGKGSQSIITLRSESMIERNETAIQAGMSQVGENYFAMLRIPVRRGRAFSVRDDEHAPLVAIIDQGLATRLFGGADPIGRRVMLIDLGSPAEVVGVVSTVRQAGRLVQTLPQVYIPFTQLPLSTFAVFAKIRGPLAEARHDIAMAVRSANPTAAVSAVTPLEDQVYDEVRRPRFYATVLGLFAAIAIVVSAAAVHAGVSALVAQRTREIGIRIALGARREHVTMLVLQRVALLGALGSSTGTACGLVMISIIRTRVSALAEPSAVAVLASVACIWTAGVLAVFVPLRRANQVNPIHVLRL